MSRLIARILVALYRVLCAITLHRWHYYSNQHGGRPMFRACTTCGKRQTWNYGVARERGRIEWVDYGNANDADPHADLGAFVSALNGDWCKRCGSDVYVDGKCAAWGCGHRKEESAQPVAWLDAFGKPHKNRADAIVDFDPENQPKPLYLAPTNGVPVAAKGSAQ